MSLHDHNPKYPAALQPGDTIAIVCTARKISEAELEPAVKLLQTWGYKVKLGSTIGLGADQFGGMDIQRTEDMQAQLDDPTVKAILCARGGYGTVRMLDGLDFTKFTEQPKWLIGYSDVTVLHAHINQNFGLPTLHATMPVNFATNAPTALKSLQQVLKGERPEYKFLTHELNRVGEAEGVLVGGNLSVLYSISGSVSDIDTDGKVLFLEDLDEYLYHIDRMMMQMKRSGKLAKLAGLVIGGMSDMNDNAIPFGRTAEQIIKEHVAEYNYPVAFGLPAGHMADNRALIMGAAVKLTVSESGNQLSFLS